jgi:hypothetical protein
MQESAQGRTRQGTALAALATIGGVIGLLAGLWLVGGTLANGGWGLLLAVFVLAFSLAELAFAYGAWTQSPSALQPGLRVAAFAVAIALIVLGVAVSLTIPVTTTMEPTGSPIVEADTPNQP